MSAIDKSVPTTILRWRPEQADAQGIALFTKLCPDRSPDQAAAIATAVIGKLDSFIRQQDSALAEQGAYSGMNSDGQEALLLDRRAKQAILADPSALRDVFKTLTGREPTAGELELFRAGAFQQIQSIESKLQKKFPDEKPSLEQLNKFASKTIDKRIKKLSNDEQECNGCDKVSKDKKIKKLSNDEQECNGCDKVSKAFKKCSRCREVVYCSRECQTAHWPTHKLVCVIPTGGAGAGAGAGSAASKS